MKFVPAVLILCSSVRGFRPSRIPKKPARFLTPRGAFTGPIGDPDEMIASIEVQEIGLTVEVGPSEISPGSLGLFARLAPGVETAALPEMSLLGGYARGKFSNDASGDKAVGFAINSPMTAVFYQRTLMSVKEALAVASISENTEVSATVLTNVKCNPRPIQLMDAAVMFMMRAGDAGRA